MSLGRSLVRFLALSAIGHELTYTVVKAHRFDDAREQLVSLSVGFLLAGIYRPNLLADTGARRRSAVRRVANLAADAVLIGIGTPVVARHPRRTAARNPGDRASGRP